jgi:hypothetical protein
MMRNKFLEIGILELFHYPYIANVILIAFVLLSGYFGQDISDLRPQERMETANTFYIWVILLPNVVQFFMMIIFKEIPTYIYLTNRGILTSMNAKEYLAWKDLSSYKVLSNLTLLRFRKKEPSKRSQFFFVTYDKDHFKKQEQEILSILDKNLKNES